MSHRGVFLSGLVAGLGTIVPCSGQVSAKVPVRSVASQAARAGGPSRLCDGTPLPACEGPFTGPSCTLPCTGSGEPSSCGLASYCHADGTVYGLSTRGALLYPGSPRDDESAVEATFVAWIVAHEAELGLEPGLEPADIELHRSSGPPVHEGPLTIYRFSQTHHGLPVLPPDDIITLVYGPDGPISVSGAIIDKRTPYAHADARATATRAQRSILQHAAAQTLRRIDTLELVYATPVAIHSARAVGWAGFVRTKGGVPLGRVIVDADPAFEGSVLPLWSYRALASSGLADTQPIEVYTLDPAGEPTDLDYSDETMLTTGSLLLGSVDDVTLELQLATEQLVVLDMQGELLDALAVGASRVLGPSGEFDANAGAGLTAQVGYHLFQGWYDYVDGLRTDPLVGAKRWDSANELYTHGMLSSNAPPGTFAPRVLAAVNANSADCPVTGTACASPAGFIPFGPEVTMFPELLHIPPGATHMEVLGQMTLPGTGIEPVTFAHEFGHIVDLFSGGGITRDLAPTCKEPCPFACVEDSTAEAAPLSESVAQLLALSLLRQSFATVDFEYCPIIDMVSVNGTKGWTPGACVPEEEDISLLQRPDDCAKPYAYCDKPEDPGFYRQCCYDGEDLGACTIELPDACPEGVAGPAGAAGTGTARAVPNGLCDYLPGYRTNSLYQAFWQLLNGQRCEPTPPFECVSMEWAPGVAPIDASTSALLYALRVRALSYEQLIDAMAIYVACTYGASAYDDFNAVVCNHGLRDCAAPLPLVCESCGNGVREGSEGCDGSDWLLTACEDLPGYSGGDVTCDALTCSLDFSECTMESEDETGAPVVDDPKTDTDTDTDTGAMGTGAVDGCGCRSTRSDARWHLALLSLAMLGMARRRRAA